jgi:hypothetical protein
MDPDQAERRFAELFEEAGLPRFASAFHDRTLDELRLTWENGVTIHIDLTRREASPIDEWSGPQSSALRGAARTPRRFAQRARGSSGARRFRCSMK